VDLAAYLKFDSSTLSGANLWVMRRCEMVCEWSVAADWLWVNGRCWLDVVRWAALLIGC